jgi:hypothetical protein
VAIALTHICRSVGDIVFRYGKSSFRTMAFISLAILAGCASKPRETTTQSQGNAYSIIAVDVTALDPSNARFANQLETALNQSAGRPSAYYGRAAKLYVRVLPIASLSNPSFGLVHRAASLNAPTTTINVRISDPSTGATFESAQFRASSTSDDLTTASYVMEERLVAQIRRFIGLNGIAPYPVKNIKKPSSTQIKKNNYPDNVTVLTDDDLNGPVNYEAKIKASDPLLNGNINSQTSVKELMVKTKKTNDAMDKDAKAMKQAVEKELMVKPLPKAKPRIIEQTQPKSQPKTQAAPAATAAPKIEAAGNDDDGELCIVTVDNDCLAVPGN